MRDLRLKQRWRRFFKTSASYYLAAIYAFIGLFFFCLALYSMFFMAANYRDGTGFYIETSEQLRAVGFMISMLLVCGSAIILALLMWICSLFMFLSEQEHRIKRLEKERAEK